MERFLVANLGHGSLDHMFGAPSGPRQVKLRDLGKVVRAVVRTKHPRASPLCARLQTDLKKLSRVTQKLDKDLRSNNAVELRQHLATLEGMYVSLEALERTSLGRTVRKLKQSSITDVAAKAELLYKVRLGLPPLQLAASHGAFVCGYYGTTAQKYLEVAKTGLRKRRDRTALEPLYGVKHSQPGKRQSKSSSKRRRRAAATNAATKRPREHQDKHSRQAVAVDPVPAAAGGGVPTASPGKAAGSCAGAGAGAGAGGGMASHTPGVATEPGAPTRAPSPSKRVRFKAVPDADAGKRSRPSQQHCGDCGGDNATCGVEAPPARKRRRRAVSDSDSESGSDLGAPRIAGGASGGGDACDGGASGGGASGGGASAGGASRAAAVSVRQIARHSPSKRRADSGHARTSVGGKQAKLVDLLRKQARHPDGGSRNAGASGTHRGRVLRRGARPQWKRCVQSTIQRKLRLKPC